MATETNAPKSVKSEYDCKLERFYVHVNNKKANIKLLKSQLIQAEKRLKRIEKLNAMNERQLELKSITDAEALEELEYQKTRLGKIGAHIVLRAAYWADKYVDKKFTEPAFFESKRCRKEWRAETHCIIKKIGSPEQRVKLRNAQTRRATKGKKPDLPPCWFYNQGRCNKPLCKHVHKCSECDFHFKDQRKHIFSPECPIYRLRKKYLAAKQGQASTEEETSSSSSNSDTDAK